MVREGLAVSKTWEARSQRLQTLQPHRTVQASIILDEMLPVRLLPGQLTHEDAQN